MLVEFLAVTMTASFFLNLVFVSGAFSYIKTRRNILFNFIKDHPDKRAHTLKAEINYVHPELYINAKAIYHDLTWMVKNEILIADFVKPCNDHKTFDFYKINESKVNWKA